MAKNRTARRSATRTSKVDQAIENAERLNAQGRDIETGEPIEHVSDETIAADLDTPAVDLSAESAEIAQASESEHISDETIEAELDGEARERPTEAELAEVLGEPIVTIVTDGGSIVEASALTPDELDTAVVVEKPADEPAQEHAKPLARRFASGSEAIAWALNMRIPHYSVEGPLEDGFLDAEGKPAPFALIPRKSDKTTTTTSPTTAPAPTPATRKDRAKRSKQSAPREGTRNAVIWSMLTRTEGTTHAEVVAAMDEFERSRGQENIFPTGIGSDWKLFANRFGYDRKKTTDADGKTRYFCFPFVLDAVPEVDKSEQQDESASAPSAA